MKKTILMLLAATIPSMMSAQMNILSDNISFVGKTEIKKGDDAIVKSVRYAPTDEDAPSTSDEFFKKFLGKENAAYFIFDRSKKAKNGMVFERYQQYYNGIKVDDGHYNFRFQNGKLKVATGHLTDVSLVNPIPDISEKSAIDSYISYLNLDRNNVVDATSKLIIKEIPKKQQENQKTTKLVYLVYIKTNSIHNPDIGYVDAHTGKIVYNQKSFYEVSANGKFYTYYNRGTYDTPKNSKTTLDDDIYILKDNTRGNIHTLKHGYIHDSEFCDSDNIWRREEMGSYNIALDIHWTFQNIFDVLLYEFDYDSYDGNGGYIYSSVYQGGNAGFYPSDNTFVFGNGNSTYGPMGAVDVVSHEFGHAILCNTTGWTNTSGEIEALHEGFADIWGIFFESYITPFADIWKMGQDLYSSTYSCTRNIAHPDDTTAETQIADTYGIGLWNNGDEHIQSGVCSHWFYLLSEGGSGINGKNHSYTVIPVGLEQAKQLFAYTVLTSAYLEDCTTLDEVKDAFCDAANDLGDAFLANQVVNAWYAVGVGSYLNSINGSDKVCDNSTYTIYDIPSQYTIQWSFSGDGGSGIPTLISNSDKSCTVYTSSPISGILSATIKQGSTALGTFTKRISGDNPTLVAYYWVNNNYMDILWEDDNYASPDDMIYVQSSNFNGKTFRLSRSSSPSSYTTLTLVGGELQFAMPNLGNAEYLTLWIEGNCGTHSYKFYHSTNNNNRNTLMVENLGDSRYLLSIIKKNKTEVMPLDLQAVNNDDNCWVLRIYSATDLKLVSTELIKENSYILDSSVLKPGVYVIRATVGNNTYTAKLTAN